MKFMLFVLPTVQVLPGSRKTFDQFQYDDARCRQFALAQSGAPSDAANSAGAGSAVVGTLMCALFSFGFASLAQAAINPNALGANYDAAQANITFKVYSSRATRIEVWLYKTPSGAQDVAHYVMTKDAATNIWSKTASVATLQNSYGITGTVRPVSGTVTSFPTSAV